MLANFLVNLVGIALFAIIGFVFFMAFYGGTKNFIELREYKKREKERLRKESNEAFLKEVNARWNAKIEAEAERQKKVIERLENGEVVPLEEAEFLYKSPNSRKLDINDIFPK